ncbi:MAG: hypothetical protein ACI88A_004551 [Paraglaciecola sp.]|jgi:hypothetical protein
MTINFSNNVNFAITSGSFGLQQASNDLTQSTFNIAQNSLLSSASQDPQEFLANAVTQQLSFVKQVLPQRNSDPTSDLLDMSIAGTNALASAKVLDTANGTVGTILDILT